MATQDKNYPKRGGEYYNKLRRPLTDKDVEDWFKEQTGQALNRADAEDDFPALTATQLEGREKNDAVRRAKLTQGENHAMPMPTTANADGTWNAGHAMQDRVWPRLEEIIGEWVKAGLERRDELILRWSLMGYSNRAVATMLQNAGYPACSQQNIFHRKRAMQHRWALWSLRAAHDNTDIDLFIMGEVTKSIPQPRSSYFKNTPCDCKRFEHCEYRKKRKARVPRGERDALGNYILTEIEYLSPCFMCVHCGQQRTLSQFKREIQGVECGDEEDYSELV